MRRFCGWLRPFVSAGDDRMAVRDCRIRLADIDDPRVPLARQHHDGDAGPKIGDAAARFVAAAFTPTVSVVSGGLLGVEAVDPLALPVPEFARYKRGDAKLRSTS